ncbi:unnamed protein product, partial [Ectocarpus sp. 13 AM-2016]
DQPGSSQPSTQGPRGAGDDHKSLETMVGGISAQFPAPPRKK